MEMLNRSQAEQRIKAAIEDFLSSDSLQEILSEIFNGEDFMVVEDGDEPDESEFED
jgi:hypothetical protein